MRSPWFSWVLAGWIGWSVAPAIVQGDEPAPAKTTTPTEHSVISKTPTDKAPTSFQDRLSQPISANFQGVDFASAIQFLSETSGINIILSEKAKQVGKPVTIHLVDMPLNHALEYLLKSQGLMSRFDEQAIWVATLDEMMSEPMQTRVFFLNEGAGLFAAFSPITETRESVALQATAVKKMRTIKNTLEEVIPRVGQSSILFDERSGALIATQVPYYLQQIEKLLVQLDIAPVQVLIEARFIEVTFTDTKEWSFDARLTGNAALTKGPARDGKTQGPELQLSSVGTTLKRGTSTNFTDFTSKNISAGNALNLSFQGILTGTQYSSLLHALVENKKAKTLSAPRVTTLNNQTATIKIVSEFVYPTKYEPSVVRNFDKLVNGNPETKFINVPQDFVTKDLGIVLYVTPSVGNDLRTITLALKPEVSDKKTDDTFNGEVKLPRFTTRNLETTVVIENGETVMLGGLMKDTTGKTITKVPLFGSLPVIGKLFRKEEETAERSNLLIFVTAQLVNPAGARLALTDTPKTF